MADPSERLDAMFPRLTPTQIARLLPVGRRRRFEPGEVDMISGRQSLVRARALDATELLEIEAAQWPLRRRPYQFETSLPRVFAVGDVRSGSMKRVASAVGEGSAVVQIVHKVLAE